jgi:hypothetical protein
MAGGDGEGDGGAAGLAGSLAKYGQLAGVLAALAATDGRRLRASWVAFSDADWDSDASGSGGGGGGAAGGLVQVGPPGFEEMLSGGGGGGCGSGRGRRRRGGGGVGGRPST